MKWIKKDIDPIKVRDLKNTYDVDLLTASILLRRGIDNPGDLSFYLEEDLKYTHNPFLFEDMEIAVDRIMEAVEGKEKILIYGDRDVDGITGTVVLVEALRLIGLDPEWKVPLENEDYGLSVGVVEDFAQREGTLIITVDCGISNKTEVDAAGELGVDVIILDHHNPGKNIPLATAVLNPKLTGTGYPFQGLSGCGVASKLSWALKLATTPLFNQMMCLVNIRPANETFEIEAVKLLNLIPVGRIVENLVPGMMGMSDSPFIQFIEGHQLFVYNEAVQKRMFQKVFGPNTDIALMDLEPEMAEFFPAVRGKSLLRMKEMSKMARYGYKRNSELDILISLFSAYITKKYDNVFSKYQKELDLVALSTVADMMPLRDENRVLVKKGFTELNKNSCDGLKELLIQLRLLGTPINTTLASWQIIPVINSSGRLGFADKSVEMFLTKDPEKRTALAQEVAGMNQTRKRLCDEAWDRIYNQAFKSQEEYCNLFTVAEDHQIMRGLTGILASRMMNSVKLTSIVLSCNNNRISGSIRAQDNFDVHGLLEYCSDLFVDYGGHAKAAGFTFEEKFRYDFYSRIKEFSKNYHPEEKEEISINVDAEIPLKFLNPDLYKVVELLEPYGEENQRLIFLSRGLRVEDITLVGRLEKDHVKLLLTGGAHKWPAIYWNAASRVGTDFNKGDKVDIVYKMGKNYYQGKESFQLTIEDLVLCAPRA